MINHERATPVTGTGSTCGATLTRSGGRGYCYCTYHNICTRRVSSLEGERGGPLVPAVAVRVSSLLEGERGGPLVPAVAVWTVANAGPKQVGVLPNRAVVVVAERLRGRRVHAAWQRVAKCLSEHPRQFRFDKGGSPGEMTLSGVVVIRQRHT